MTKDELKTQLKQAFKDNSRNLAALTKEQIEVHQSLTLEERNEMAAELYEDIFPEMFSKEQWETALTNDTK